LPKEIAEKVVNFDRYYSDIFKKYLSNSDLRYIIADGTEEYKTKAKELLNKLNK
jgi:hypothetical protein